MESIAGCTHRPQQRSTRIAFFIAGFGMAAWAPLVPFAKARAGLDDGALGLLLLCLGVGSIVADAAGGRACRACSAAAGRSSRRRVLICLALPLLATASSPAAARCRRCFVFGAGLGTVDVADEHPGDHRRARAAAGR